MDSCQSIAFPADFFSDVIDLLPKILNHFDQVAKKLKEIVEKSTNDGDSESESSVTDELFTDETNLIKVCFGLCIRLLAALFTWPEFADDANKNTLTSEMQM